MLRFKNLPTKILITIREVRHHLSLTLNMYGKITNDRFRKMETLLKLGQLLGSYRELMISIRANVTKLTTS